MSDYFYDQLEPTPEPHPEELDEDAFQVLEAAMTGIATAATSLAGSVAEAVSPVGDMIKYLANLRAAYAYGRQSKWPVVQATEIPYQPPSLGLMQVIPPNFDFKTGEKYKAEQLKIDLEQIKKYYKSTSSVHKVDSTWRKWLNGR
jgi:hypothetical protein